MSNITFKVKVPKSQYKGFIDRLDVDLFTRYKDTVLKGQQYYIGKPYPSDVYGFLTSCYNVYTIIGVKTNDSVFVTSLQTELDLMKGYYQSVITSFAKIKRDDFINHGKVIFDCMNAVHEDLKQAITEYPFLSYFFTSEQLKRLNI